MPPQTVLLVDRDLDSLNIYSLMLEHHGYRVVRADSDEGGFRAACDAEPSLVITELFLSGSAPGALLVERLKQDPRTLHLPVLAVSTRTVAPNHPLLDACDTYLSKPCVPTRLLQEVQRMLPIAAELPA